MNTQICCQQFGDGAFTRHNDIYKR